MRPRPEPLSVKLPSVASCAAEPASPGPPTSAEVQPVGSGPLAPPVSTVTVAGEEVSRPSLTVKVKLSLPVQPEAGV